jgi:small subunit ribosomal protein S5
MAENNTTAPAAAAEAQAAQQHQAPQAPQGPQGHGGYQGNRGGRGPGQGGRGQGGPRRDGRRPELAPEEKQFDERVLHIDRVARVVKGGRRFRFRALVVVGDRKNRVGIGISKGADVTAAVTKATEVAKKHFIIVNTTKNGSIPHEFEAKVGGARILIKPASAGTGLIAGGVVRTILEVAGVKNILSKSLGSTNKANTAYATIEALRNVVPASEWVTAPALKAAREERAKNAVTKKPVAEKAAPKAAATAPAKEAAKAEKPAAKPAAKTADKKVEKTEKADKADKKEAPKKAPTKKAAPKKETK